LGDTGGIGTEAVETASRLGAIGLDPLKFLNTKSSIERSLMIHLANRIIAHKEIQDQNLAVKIAENVGKLFKK
jgi:hypothetical protein